MTKKEATKKEMSETSRRAVGGICPYQAAKSQNPQYTKSNNQCTVRPTTHKKSGTDRNGISQKETQNHRNAGRDAHSTVIRDRERNTLPERDLERPGGGVSTR